MALATGTWSSTWFTATTTPVITAAPLLRLRDESQWNTCGYVDGDTRHPYTLCDDCICESTSGVMVECSGTAEGRTCGSPIYLCYPSTYVHDGYLPADGEVFCTEPSSTECEVMYWTDIEVYSIMGCGPRDLVVSLSFSHPETTTTAASSDTIRSASLSSTQTRIAVPVATSTAAPKHEPFTPAETAGLVVGLVAAVAFIVGALFVFFRKRRDAAAAGKSHTDSIVKRHSERNLAGALATAGASQDQNKVDSPSEEKVANHGTSQTPQVPYPDATTAQPSLPVTATGTLVSPNISPGPSPSITPTPHGQSLSSQPSNTHLSAIYPLSAADISRASYIPMPPYPGTPPIDRRFSPSPDHTVRSFSNDSQIRLPPGLVSGNMSSSNLPYTSIYSGFSPGPTAPGSHISQVGMQPPKSETPPVPRMAASWFQERDSVVSELDATGAIGSPGTPSGARDNRMTAAIERLGAGPGRAR